MIKRLFRKLFPLHAAKRGGLIIGKNVSFSSKRSVIFGTEPYLISIGDNVRISGKVAFITHDGGTWSFRYKEGFRDVFKYGRISVGDYTFIGYNATILPGVTIGKNCVIGAGSVVTKDIPDGSVVAGVPAKFICSTDEYANKIIKLMPRDVDWDNYRKNKKNEVLKHYSKK